MADVARWSPRCSACVRNFRPHTRRVSARWRKGRHPARVESHARRAKPWNARASIPKPDRYRNNRHDLDLPHIQTLTWASTQSSPPPRRDVRPPRLARAITSCTSSSWRDRPRWNQGDREDGPRLTPLLSGAPVLLAPLRPPPRSSQALPRTTRGTRGAAGGHRAAAPRAPSECMPVQRLSMLIAPEPSATALTGSR